MATIRCFVGTLTECSRAQALCNKLYDYPKDGIDIGGGRHAPRFPGGPTWTIRYASPVAHPTLPSTFVLPMEATVLSAEQRNLSESERSELSTISLAAVLVTFPDPL